MMMMMRAKESALSAFCRERSRFWATLAFARRSFAGTTRKRKAELPCSALAVVADAGHGLGTSF